MKVLARTAQIAMAAMRRRCEGGNNKSAVLRVQVHVTQESMPGLACVCSCEHVHRNTSTCPQIHALEFMK